MGGDGDKLTFLSIRQVRAGVRILQMMRGLDLDPLTPLFLPLGFPRLCLCGGRAGWVQGQDRSC